MDIEKELEESLRRLEQMVLGARRIVEIPAKDGATKGVTAFGQWVTKAEGDPLRGQHGIFGTAAGLEVLAAACEVGENFADPGSLWPGHMLGAWEYLRSRLAPQGGDRATQFFLVLRQATTLRALSTVEQRFERLVHGEEGIGRHANRLFAQDVLDEMLLARELQMSVEMPESVTRDEVSGYRFASKSTDKPKLDTDWAFHLAAVLIAVVRCAQAGLFRGAEQSDSDEKAQRPIDFVGKIECEMLCNWSIDALGDSSGDRFRVGLFAGWALLHLDQDTDLKPPHGPAPLHEPRRVSGIEELKLSPKLHGELQVSLVKATRRVLDDVSIRSDLHSPYFYRLNSDIVGDKRDDDAPFRQEHFVVPTVPIALSVIARLGGGLMAERRCQRLLGDVVRSVVNGNPPVVPAQPSAANGTMNMMYLHEALDDLRRAARGLADGPFSTRAWISIKFYRPSRRLMTDPWLVGISSSLVGTVVGIAATLALS